MSFSKKIRVFLYAAGFCLVLLTAYILSFDAIEPVCNKTEDREVFLLNYISENSLKDKIYKHSKRITFKGNEHTRVYLRHNILHIPNPVFNDDYSYKPDGCDNIDVMDVYCIADFEKQENGKITVSYNFMEDEK